MDEPLSGLTWLSVGRGAAADLLRVLACEDIPLTHEAFRTRQPWRGRSPARTAHGLQPLSHGVSACGTDPVSRYDTSGSPPGRPARTESARPDRDLRIRAEPPSGEQGAPPEVVVGGADTGPA
jgi:hypothetical protein